MLIQFTVGNWGPFKEKRTLSLVASNYNKERDENVFIDNGFKLLKSAVIYGANASGKTKFIEAFGVFKLIVLNSFNESYTEEPLLVQPFMLNEEFQKKPTFFEIVFTYGNELFRYGFEALNGTVASEWLFYKAKSKEVEIFNRVGQKFGKVNSIFKIGQDLISKKMIGKNTLLVSASAKYNDEISKKLRISLMSMRLLSGIFDLSHEGFTVGMSQRSKYGKDSILGFIQYADLGIEDFRIVETDLSTLPGKLLEEVKVRLKRNNANKLYEDVKTKHKLFNEKNRVIGDVELSLEEDGSAGTKKYFAMAGPILDTLRNGNVLFADELDAKLHPILVERIITLFNSQETNPKNAQLIFNTHNSNLLTGGIFRRDQIWFTEKDKYGATDLYSLSDIKARSDENYEKNYIQGKYGAIPYIRAYKKLEYKENGKEKNK